MSAFSLVKTCVGLRRRRRLLSSSCVVVCVCVAPNVSTVFADQTSAPQPPCSARQLAARVMIQPLALGSASVVPSYINLFSGKAAQTSHLLREICKNHFLLNQKKQNKKKKNCPIKNPNSVFGSIVFTLSSNVERDIST